VNESAEYQCQYKAALERAVGLSADKGISFRKYSNCKKNRKGTAQPMIYWCLGALFIVMALFVSYWIHRDSSTALIRSASASMSSLSRSSTRWGGAADLAATCNTAPPYRSLQMEIYLEAA
jgi:hypothetical protein